MVGKNGIFTESDFLELIHTEPDGSKWLHVFHHNNPSVNLFSSSDDFENGVYKSKDMWFFVNYCKNFTKWEFLHIQRSTETANPVKHRWIQTVSPYGTSYDAVKPASVTRISTSGYTDDGQGGMYKMNSSTYLVITNTSNGNWFGATGCWTAYQGGIPGFPSTVVTTGCIDMFIRIDNTTVPQNSITTKIRKDSIQSVNFIEI